MTKYRCDSCGHPLTVEQPMTSLGYLLAGALMCFIVFAFWWLCLFYGPRVVAWWGGMS